MGKHTGVLSKIKSHLDRNRLGELLVIQGRLSPQDLKLALSQQSATRIPLGKILVESGMVRKREIHTAIATQWAMRSLATFVAVLIATSALNVRQSHASNTQTVASVSGPAVAGINSYPELFGSGEKRSSDLSAFTKWSAMFSRFDKQMASNANDPALIKWREDLEKIKGLPFDEMVERVNTMANKVRYITDNKNYGKSDYWATPLEFFTRGGDCEDFAIAKYASLRALGVPDSRMRISVLKDTQKGIAHAVLIVYTDKGAVVLDNQIKSVKRDREIAHYKPIFSINRTAWWLHTPSKGTLVASR